MRYVCRLIAFAIALTAIGVGAALATTNRGAGSLDRSFSGNGKAQIGLSQRRACQGDTPGKSCDDYAHSVAIDRHGRIVIGGLTDAGNDYIAGIVRLLPNGKPDDSFAGDGQGTFTTPESLR